MLWGALILLGTSAWGPAQLSLTSTAAARGAAPQAADASEVQLRRHDAPEAPPPRAGDSEASPQTDDAPAPWWVPLGLSVSLDASVGTGTFVASRYADDPYYASTLTVSPSWALTEDLTASASLGLSYEWTALVTPCHPASGPRPAGAPAEDCSDTADPNGRRADLDDLTLSLAHRELYALEGFVLGAGTSVALPTSRASRAASLVLSWGLGATISRPIGPVTPSLSLGLRKYFALDDAPLADADTGEGQLPIGRCRNGRTTACLLLSGFVPSWRLGLDLSVEVELPAGFDVSLGLGYSYTANHSRPPDAARSPRRDAAGTPVVDGVGEFDGTSGSIELGFTVTEQLRVGLGVASAQPALTADNSAVRFPFFDFLSPANNYSAWYAAVSWNL